MQHKCFPRSGDYCKKHVAIGPVVLAKTEYASIGPVMRANNGSIGPVIPTRKSVSIGPVVRARKYVSIGPVTFANTHL